MSKASSLIDLTNSGIRVPEFIVLEEKGSEVLNKGLVDSFLMQFADSTRFAVRSSADVEDGDDFSYAGMFDTYLNLRKKDVYSYVRKCVSSKKNSRVKEYIKGKGIAVSDIRMQIVVQRMLTPEISGVMFCEDPTKCRKDVYVIECVYGLGEGLVSGLIPPDRIFWDPATKKILDYKVSFQENKLVNDINQSGTLLKAVALLDQSRRKITYDQLNTLSDIAKVICNMMKTKADIEWCFENQTLFILQARPITTVK